MTTLLVEQPMPGGGQGLSEPGSFGQAITRDILWRLFQDDCEIAQEMMKAGNIPSAIDAVIRARKRLEEIGALPKEACRSRRAMEIVP